MPGSQSVRTGSIANPEPTTNGVKMNESNSIASRYLGCPRFHGTRRSATGRRRADGHRMRRLLLTCSFGAAFLLMATASPALARDARPPDPANVSLDRNATARAWSDRSVVRVNCDRGQKLGRALRRVRAGTTVVVRGRCVEQVHVVTDDVRILGVRDAVIDGAIGRIALPGTITVSGASGVEIRGLTRGQRTRSGHRGAERVQCGAAQSHRQRRCDGRRDG